MKLNTQQQATHLLKETSTADLVISVPPHRSLNRSQGVISEEDLLNETEAELLEGLEDQGVTAVRRILIRRDKEITTKYLFFTFNPPALPETMNAGFVNIELDNPTMDVFVDYRKAFDPISHETLLKQLYRYGVRGVPTVC